LRPKSSTNFVRPEVELYSLGRSRNTPKRLDLESLATREIHFHIYTFHFTALQEILSLFYVCLFIYFGFSYFSILELDEGTNPKIPCIVMKDKRVSRLKYCTVVGSLSIVDDHLSTAGHLLSHKYFLSQKAKENKKAEIF
jgi:hypothetical protein